MIVTTINKSAKSNKRPLIPPKPRQQQSSRKSNKNFDPYYNNRQLLYQRAISTTNVTIDSSQQRRYHTHHIFIHKLEATFERKHPRKRSKQRIIEKKTSWTTCLILPIGNDHSGQPIRSELL